MAVTINGSTASAYWTFKLVVSEGAANIANNTSPLTVDVYIGRGASAGSSYMYGANISCPVSVTGCATQTITYKNSGKVTVAAGGWLHIGSTTFGAVPHDADGSKTVTVSASFTNNVSPSSGSASGNVALTTIARATQPVIYTSNIDMGKNITITLPRASSSFAHVLRWVFGDEAGFISGYAEDEVNWVIPLTLANLIPNATSGILYIYCATYNGETLIGTKSVSLTINVPSDIIPTVSIATSDPTGFKNKYGAFVQGQSKFKTDVTASGVYGSTIKSCKVTADGKTYTTDSVTTDVISGSGELTITAIVTDSRNRSSLVPGKVDVLPYTAPKINSISVYRCNEDGAKTTGGGYLAVDFSAEITALNNKNSAVYVVQYKKSADTNYTAETLTDYSGQYTIQSGVFIFAADTSSSYDIILTASDDFSSVERTATGSSIKKLWSILKRGFGFAFGKIAELENTLEIALDALFHNKANFLKGLQINGTDLDDFVVEQGESDGWFYRKWDSGYIELYGKTTAEFTGMGHYLSAYSKFPIELTNWISATATINGFSGNLAAYLDANVKLECFNYGCNVWVQNSYNGFNGPDSTPVSIHVFGKWK